jgi:2-methylaconitate cis-trans-isomerase PrpF
MQTAIPCLLMRGGTPRDPFLKASDLPACAHAGHRGGPQRRRQDDLGRAPDREFSVEPDPTNPQTVARAALLRTACLLMCGQAMIPASVWSPAQ